MSTVPGREIIYDDDGNIVYIDEGEDAYITGTLKDVKTGATIDDSALTAVTASLCYINNSNEQTIINGRDGSDIYNDNGGTIDPDGTFHLYLDPLDNTRVGEENPETHVLVVQFTWVDGDGEDRSGKQQYELYVVGTKTTQVPTATIKTDIDLSGVRRVKTKHMEVEAFDPLMMQRVRDKELATLPSFCDVNICVGIPKRIRTPRND